MALFIRQDDERSELQKRIAAELHRKANEKSVLSDRPDGVEDSQYIKGSKTSGPHAWIWVLGLLVVAAAIIWLTVVSMAR
jgi:hypothetical protein